ncbi:DUF4270 domain-containing protein [Salegentibacter sp. LM13S]|uniref:DUF4270 family protein n=1 Tax=Salegentibacter lacus TaxID=2873599 RepID=UPI001CD03CF4|nr:DUF4270 family protein [Salegentibacter lacus]MBZ9631596.1 DUF4270 domain-containing protein [Salegentibacter lacus]
MKFHIQRNPIIISILFISAFLLFSCSEDSDISEVADNWINSNTKVYFIDTLTVNSSTFKFDSLSVSGSNRLLIGAYTDEDFGYIESKVFAPIYPSTYTIDSEAELDSVALILNYDGYAYNDTLQNQVFNVYEILEKVDNDGEDFYNTTSFKVAENAIGVKNFKPYPTLNDSLHITIDYNFGEGIFEKIKNKDLTNTEDFMREYRGISIVPDRENTGVLGFSRESSLRLYYSISAEVDSEEKTLDLNFNESDSFNHISSNNAGSLLDSLSQNSYLSSLDSDNQTFIQGGTGIATRIDFPNMEALNNIQGEGTIMDANLKIYLKTRDNKLSSPSNSLQFYIINQHSDIIGNLYDYNQTTVTGEIHQESQEFNIISYSVPLKYYLDSKASDPNGNNWYLIMYGQDFSSSVDGYIFYGEKAPGDRRMKLELTYALYDE